MVLDSEPRRPLDPDRYSPVRVSVLRHLPESNARSFMIASALGNILDGDGTRNNVKSAKDATGIVISKKKRDVILGELGIDARRWRRLVSDWERRQVAHRCERGVVTLFTKPFLPECPSCRQPVEATEGQTPSIRSKPRGAAFGEAGRIDPSKRVRSALLSGADRTARAAQIEPFSGTNSEHPNRGVAIRDEEGLEEEVALEGSEVGLEGSSEGSREIRRDRDSNTGGRVGDRR